MPYNNAKNRKYFVKKLKVYKGCQFLEDWYRPFNEDIVGIWSKYGLGFTHENPAMVKFKCNSCIQAAQCYQEKIETIKMK